MAFERYQIMIRPALDTDKVRAGMKSILLGPAGLYEGLVPFLIQWRINNHGQAPIERLRSESLSKSRKATSR